MKNRLLKIAGAALVLLTFAGLAKAVSPKPNILFAIADDASWKSFGAYGCEWIKTPAFDRVANHGILFTNAYTPNAKCAPSRASILTGRNSWQLAEACNHNPRFPAKFKTYAEALGENGYFVGSVAKGWAPGDPGKVNGKRRELAGPRFDNLKTEAPTSSISDIDYAANFEAFLKSRPEDKPFCFWYGGHEPHRSYEYGSGIRKGGKYMQEIREVPTFWPDVDTVRTDLLDYAFELEYFDKQLMKMLETLEKAGELANTIVVVCADNGMPFPRIKGQEYEYSNHLPLAIMWPDGIKNPGRVVDDYVSFIDIAPTFLDLAGLTDQSVGMQPIEGKSLSDILYAEYDGRVTSSRNYVLIGKERHDVGRPDDKGYPIRGIVEDGFLYLINFEAERWPVGNPEVGYPNCDASPTKSYILNTRRHNSDWRYWQWNFGKRVAEELYDVQQDPFCINNLAGVAVHSELKEKLKLKLIEKLTEQQDPRILGNGEIFEQFEFAGQARNFYNRKMNGENVPSQWINDSDVDLDLIETKVHKN